MTVAELIQRLQSLDVDPDTPINFLVNDFNNVKVDTIDVQAHICIMRPGGSWRVRKEVDFHLEEE